MVLSLIPGSFSLLDKTRKPLPHLHMNLAGGEMLNTNSFFELFLKKMLLVCLKWIIRYTTAVNEQDMKPVHIAQVSYFVHFLFYDSLWWLGFSYFLFPLNTNYGFYLSHSFLT